MMLHHSPALVVVKDPEGRILLANRRYEALPVQPPEVARAQRESDQFALQAGDSIEVEETFVQADGTRRTYLSVKFPMFHDGLEPYATCAISTDITERKRIEIELRGRLAELGALNRRLEEAQNQLLQSEKMASIGQLAAGVAHELNNPISFVYSNYGSLKSYVEDLFAMLDAWDGALACPDAVRCPTVATVERLKAERDLSFLRTDIGELMDESREGLERVRKIVQDLKDFSHVADTEFHWADLHRGLDSTLNIVHNELKYKARVVKEYGDLPEIYCVPSQLNQVFMNMLVNAAHAIVDNGVITVRTGRGADCVWVEIADTGRGIAPEHLKRIFDPFFTTKPVGEGTGLGLSLSYSIVKKHGGRIDVCSEPGAGSTFRVTLPIDPKPEAEQAG